MTRALMRAKDHPDQHRRLRKNVAPVVDNAVGDQPVAGASAWLAVETPDRQRKHNDSLHRVPPYVI
jgi:hypothetical protein